MGQPPLAALVQTWTKTTVTTNLVSTVAAASARLNLHLGSVSTVFLTQTPERDSGNQNMQLFALQRVAMTQVSNFSFVCCFLLSSPVISAFAGDVKSPNHPGRYPNNVEKINTIQAKSNDILLLEFTDLAVEACGGVDTCSCDHVNVTDETGTALMNKTCGFSNRKPDQTNYFKPPVIKSTSNTVHIFFHSDGHNTRNGWSLKWISISTGPNTLSNLLNIFFSCKRC